MQKINAHEGYQAFIHSLKTKLQLYSHILAFVVALHMLSSVVIIYMTVNVDEIQLLMDWVYAKCVNFLNLNVGMTVHYPDGRNFLTTSDLILNSQLIRNYASESFMTIKRIFVLTMAVYLLFPVLIKFFAYWSKRSEKYIRGSKLYSIPELNKEMAKRIEKPGLPFGKIKMPESGETKSSLILGSPGVGKTVLMRQILQRLIERHERIIVYDFKGDYLERFYDRDRGDRILNPLDKRCYGYNIFNDIHHHPDVDAVCTSLIPPSVSSSDPFWNDSARDVLIGIFHYLIQNNFKTNNEIWKMVTASGVNIAACLKTTIGGERGLRHLEEPSSKLALSVLSVMTGYCRCFEYLAGIDGDFSITKWIENGSGCLFITNSADVQDSLRPILSLFMDLFARKLLSMPDTTSQKTFFLIDEFGSLQQMQSVIKLLTVARSKGGCCFIGIQDLGQIDKIYSREHRETIVNACGNKVIFSVKDVNTAKYCSELLGDTERLNSDKTLSMGKTSLKSRASLNFKKHREALFLPSMIMDLNDLQCIVKFSNYPPVISPLTYQHYETRSVSFELRDDLLLTKQEDSENGKQ
jgi:type IV secretory pathway TraG/TraD family ATPase VirD4